MTTPKNKSKGKVRASLSDFWRAPFRAVRGAFRALTGHATLAQRKEARIRALLFDVARIATTARVCADADLRVRVAPKTDRWRLWRDGLSLGAPHRDETDGQVVDRWLGEVLLAALRLAHCGVTTTEMETHPAQPQADGYYIDEATMRTMYRRLLAWGLAVARVAAIAARRWPGWRGYIDAALAACAADTYGGSLAELRAHEATDDTARVLLATLETLAQADARPEVARAVQLACACESEFQIYGVAGALLNLLVPREVPPPDEYEPPEPPGRGRGRGRGGDDEYEPGHEPDDDDDTDDDDTDTDTDDTDDTERKEPPKGHEPGKGKGETEPPPRLPEPPKNKPDRRRQSSRGGKTRGVRSGYTPFDDLASLAESPVITSADCAWVETVRLETPPVTSDALQDGFNLAATVRHLVTLVESVVAWRGTDVCRWREGEQRTGELDDASLWRVATDDERPRVYAQERAWVRPRILLGLLIDGSGSMSSGSYDATSSEYIPRIESARRIAATLYQCAAQSRVALRAAVHTSRGVTATVRTLAEPDTPVQDALARIAYYCNAMNNNADGYALLTFGTDVARTAGEYARRVVVVISDGLPYSEGYGGRPAMEHTRRVAEYLRGEGVEVYAVGVGGDESRDCPTMYGEANTVVLYRADATEVLTKLAPWLARITDGE